MIDNFAPGRTYVYTGNRLSTWVKPNRTGLVADGRPHKCVRALPGGYALFDGQTPTKQSGRNGCWDYGKVLRNFSEVDPATGKPIVVTLDVVDVEAVRKNVRSRLLDFS